VDPAEPVKGKMKRLRRNEVRKVTDTSLYCKASKDLDYVCEDFIFSVMLSYASVFNKSMTMLFSCSKDVSSCSVEE
jgi:hypothetical protein